ncbi:hypothetical protein [Specibacter sp. RAF43]|uniref:hypothetical protein n=1 Tax=Specibacter sp. RAF43 TaxID=3233057 RepID=UPI003F9746DC
MSTEIIITGLAVAVAIGALFYTARSANAAKKQTEIQSQMNKAAAEPYIWADLRPDEAQGGLLLLIVGNSGPTVATNVRVNFSPELRMASKDSSEHATEVLRRGLPSLAPGRVWKWSMGVAWQTVEEGQEPAYDITIEADGPFGPLDKLEYTIGLQEIRHTLAVPAGSLHTISTAVGKLNDTLKKIDGKLDRDDDD